MAQSAKDYFSQLFRNAGIDEATASTVITALSHEKVAGDADRIVKIATEDYNAQVGRVQSLQQRMGEYERWYQTALPEYQQMKSELDALKAGGNPTPSIDLSRVVTKDDLLKYDQERAAKFAAVQMDTAEIVTDYVTRFGRRLDLREVDKIAQEQNLPIKAAYDAYIRPDLEKKQNEELEARIKREREQAVQEFSSRHKLPVDPAPTESAPIFSHLTGKTQAPADIDAELMNVWNSGARK